MDTPEDFLETEIKKILDILEKQCKTFCIKDNKTPFLEKGVVVKESESKSG